MDQNNLKITWNWSVRSCELFSAKTAKIYKIYTYLICIQQLSLRITAWVNILIYTIYMINTSLDYRVYSNMVVSVNKTRPKSPMQIYKCMHMGFSKWPRPPKRMLFNLKVAFHKCSCLANTFTISKSSDKHSSGVHEILCKT